MLKGGGQKEFKQRRLVPLQPITKSREGSPAQTVNVSRSEEGGDGPKPLHTRSKRKREVNDC